jgi:hypothetical protein
MRRVAVGLASLIAVSFTGPASSESEFDAIQNAEQPGSQINFTFGGGSGLSVSRANSGPLFGGAGRAFFGGGVGAADGNLARRRSRRQRPARRRSRGPVGAW